MTDYPRRRSSDWSPDDHDLLIKLSADMANFIARIDSHLGDFNQNLITHRAETAANVTEIRTRLTVLETWKHRMDGAAVAGKEALMLAFAAGGLVVGAAGLALKLMGAL